MVALWSRIRRLLPQRPLQTLRSLDAYKLWAASYPPYAHNRLMQIEQTAMLKLMPDLNDRAVLDLACGTGRYGRIAVRAGARKVVGTDNSAAMLAGGSDVAIQRILAPMNQLPIAPGCFDVILCGLAMGHLPPDQMYQAVGEMGRVLRSGGEALISDFHPLLYANGGQRTFTAPDGKAYAVEHYPHSLEDYRQAILSAGMTVVGVEEPDAAINGSRMPAALVIRCQRS